MSRGNRNSPIARFLCDVARVKQQDDNAGQAYAWALELDPNCAEAWNGIGRCEMGKGNFDYAINAFSRAIALKLNFAEAYIHRGVALDRQGLSSHALADLRTASELDPNITLAELLIYGILENQERYAEAHTALAAGLAKRPDDTDLLFCRSTLLLGAGAWAAGWRDYEYRPTKLQLSSMLDEYPEWDGAGSLVGKRILVCREQGLGDEIMFARYIEPLARRGGLVIVYCYAALARVLARIPGVAEVVTNDADVPEFDCWVAIGSLPLKLAASELEGRSAYLSVESDWMFPVDRPFRVGLCWQGNKAHARDSFRSIAFKELAPLLEVEGVEFVSLQQGDTESGLEPVGNRCYDLHDLGVEMHRLDLVITVDTATAHLAGALGIPTWLLLGKPSDWRWNFTLYKSVRIFANEAPKKWTSCVKAMEGELAALARLRGPSFPQARALVTQSTAVAETRHGHMTYFVDDMWLGRSLRIYGEWSEGECELYRRVVKPTDTVIEVGANIGAHTMELGKLAAFVYALEPSRDTFQVLEQNVAALPVLCMQNAVAEVCGEGTIHRHSSNPGGAELKGCGEVSAADRTVDTVDVVTIDWLVYNARIKGLHFLKADCEGSELEVLKGAESAIANYRPLLYVENDRQDKSEALITWIHQHGYRMYQHMIPLFNPKNYSGCKINVFGNIVSAMLFCVPNERYDLRPTEWGMQRVRVTRQ